MTDTTDIPSPPAPAAADAADARRQTSRAPSGVPRTPSLRVSAGLAALMLGIGIAVGAAIGPAPSSSLAGTSDLPLVLRALGAFEAGRQPSAASAAPPTSPAASPATGAAAQPASQLSSRPAGTGTPSQPASSTTSPAPSAAAPVPSAPKTKGTGPTASLPPITSVSLVELSGEGFGQTQADASAAPYLTGQATSAGALLSSWSTLDASAFASEAALLAGSPPQTLDTIAQPPCPEGAAGSTCAPGTPGALTAADEFLKQVVTTITATQAYRAHGLIVVTFSSIASATATGLPAGAASASLGSQPPAGVLLISPFVSPGTHPSASFNPTSPKQSLERLLRK